MPSMITHYLLAKRALSRVHVADEGAFFVGAQGPDLFFFFRAYPWLLGKSGFRAGNELHEMDTAELLACMRQCHEAISDVEARSVVDSYMMGFLCHYAVDRTIHPLIKSRQTELRQQMTIRASDIEPYHFYYESAIDTLFLKQETGLSLSRFSLRSTLPKPSKTRDKALATFYESVLPMTVGEAYSAKQLRHLTADMRQSMFFMTDRFGVKRPLIRAAEWITRRDAILSSLVRTKRLYGFDYLNSTHRRFESAERGVCFDDFDSLCERAVSLAVSLCEAYRNGVDTAAMVSNIGFAGNRIQ